MELERSYGTVSLGQIKGPCNDVVSDELEAAVDTWFEAA